MNIAGFVLWQTAKVLSTKRSTFFPLHQRQATSTWWCSPLPCTGEGRNGLSIPRGSHPRAILPWTTLLIFYPCCPMRGHMWTALLNPIDRPPTPSILSRTSLPRPSFHPKPLHYSSHSPLILISILLLISGDIHPNPGPIDPCSVCSRRVTWGNRSIQCTGCSLWVHLSCSGLSPADFRKISPGHSWTCPMCPSSSQPPPSLSHSNPISSFFSASPSSHTPNPPPSLTINHKTISSKTKPSPKTTSNNPTYLPNHPQLIYTYPPSALTTPSPQTQQTTSPLTQSSFHPSSPSQNNLRFLQWNANGIRPRRTELLHFLSHNQYDLIFIQESHLSSDSTFRIPGYKTLQKNRFMTRRGTTNSTGNLGGGVLIRKLAGMNTLLILIPTVPLLLTLQHSLFLKPPTPLPNSSMMLPLLPFLSAASTVLLKPGGLLKSQMPSQNAERHLRRHTVPKKTASTISLHPDIPPL